MIKGSPREGRAQKVKRERSDAQSKVLLASQNFGHFAKLPYELIHDIFSYVPQCYLPLRQVCKESKRVVDIYQLLPQMTQALQEVFEASQKRGSLFKRQQREIDYLLKNKNDILEMTLDREIKRLSLEGQKSSQEPASNRSSVIEYLVSENPVSPRKKGLQKLFRDLERLKTNESDISLYVRHIVLNRINVEMVRSEFSFEELSAMIRDKKVLEFSRLMLTRLPSNLFEALDIKCFENQIVAMNLANNHLSRIPRWLQRLKSLRILDLSHNRIFKLPAMEELSHLGALLLAGNRLKKVPEDIATLERLAYLDVRQNFLIQAPHIPERKLITFEDYEITPAEVSKVLSPDYWKKYIAVKPLTRNQLMAEQRVPKCKPKILRAAV